MILISISFTFDIVKSNYLSFFRIYEDNLRHIQPNIQDSEIDTKLETEFASWFERYVSINRFTLFFFVHKI